MYVHSYKLKFKKLNYLNYYFNIDVFTIFIIKYYDKKKNYIIEHKPDASTPQSIFFTFFS